MSPDAFDDDDLANAEDRMRQAAARTPDSAAGPVSPLTAEQLANIREDWKTRPEQFVYNAGAWLATLDAAAPSQPVPSGLPRAGDTVWAWRIWTKGDDIPAGWTLASQPVPSGLEVSGDAYTRDALAAAICAERPPIVDEVEFVDDECRMWANRVVSRLAATAAPAAEEQG